MNYKQLTINERHAIDILFDIKKESIVSIAYSLNRSKSTIYREIKRNSINGVCTFEITESKKVKRRDRLRQYYRKGRKRKVGIFSQFNNKRVKPIWTKPKSIDLRLE